MTMRRAITRGQNLPPHGRHAHPPPSHRGARGARPAARRPRPRAPARPVGARRAADVQPQPRALGIHGRGRRRRAADGPEHRHGRPERGDRRGGADRPGCAAAGARRDVRRAGAGARARVAAGVAARAVPRRREPRAGRRRSRGSPTPASPRRSSRAAPSAAAGTTVSTDLFYDPDEGAQDEWVAAGALAVEMEAAAVFAVAARHGVPAACLLAVSDMLLARARAARRRRARAEWARSSAASPRRRSPGPPSALPTFRRSWPRATLSAVPTTVSRISDQLLRHQGELLLDRGQPLVDAACGDRPCTLRRACRRRLRCPRGAARPT